MNRRLETTLDYLFKAIDSEQLTLDMLAKILYLGDWKYALESQGKTISNAVWKKCDNRPYSDDLVQYLNNNTHFAVDRLTPNCRDWIVRIVSSGDNDDLSDKMKNVIDYVVESSRKISPDDIVSMTYPMFAYDENSTINMSALAQDYLKNVRPNLKTLV